MTSLYTNITNILVRISPTGAPSAALDHALLISAHYDSIIGSPGASDDVAAIAVMMDVLLLMTRVEHRGHAVIFNFNGAEENVLQASHGFITQHPWTKSIRAFINMEATGSGGQEILFQAGPKHPWLVRAYAESVPRPFASVFGQVRFRSPGPAPLPLCIAVVLVLSYLCPAWQ